MSDYDKSSTWYATVLGFEGLFREDGEERRANVVRFPDGGYSVGVVQRVPSPDTAFDPRRRGLDHVAFTVGSLDELHRWADQLTSAGIAHSGVVDIPPGAIPNFKDPDGISLALFWDRPETG